MPILFYVPHLCTNSFFLPYSTSSPIFLFSPPPELFFFFWDVCLSFDIFSCSVVLLQTPEELDDSDFETEDFDVRSRTSVQTEDDQLIAGQSARVCCSEVLILYLLLFL